MEKFGQILFAIQGHPEKASNQKKQIFDKYYNDIFDEKKFNITESADYVKRYYEIKQVYDDKENGYKSTDQKIFYILYIDTFNKTKTVFEKIIFFESVILSYRQNEAIPDARKLIQSKFKELLDSELKNF